MSSGKQSQFRRLKSKGLIILIAKDYLEELMQIERECGEFAAAHPHVASRLRLGSDGSSDPQLQQLLEAVAYLAARLKRQIECVPGELICSILSLVSPAIVRPVPSMGLVKYNPLINRGALAELKIPARSLVTGVNGDGSACSFSTAFETILRPISLSSFMAGGTNGSEDIYPAAIRMPAFVIRVTSLTSPFNAGDFGQLDCFVVGSVVRSLAAVESLVVGTYSVHAIGEQGDWLCQLPSDSVSAIEFTDRERRFLPTSSAVDCVSHAALEFLSFPAAYANFSIRGICLPHKCRYFDIVFSMKDQYQDLAQGAVGKIIANCIPIINVYQKSSNVVPLTKYQVDYPILRPRGTVNEWDVYAVRSIRLRAKGVVELPEYYASLQGGGMPALTWREGRNDRICGTGAYCTATLSLVEQPGSNCWQEGDSIIADLLCTDGTAAERMLPGADMSCAGVPKSYAGSLVSGMSPYVCPLTPSSVTTDHLLRLMAEKRIRPAFPLAMLRNYLVSWNRCKNQFAAEAIGSVRSITREMVALPVKGGAKSDCKQLGLMYHVELNDSADTDGIGFFVGKLLYALMTVLNDVINPIQVCIHSKRGDYLVGTGWIDDPIH